MLTTYIHYGLLIALAIALLFAAFTDIRSRTIHNWLNLCDRRRRARILVGKWSMALWPDVGYPAGRCTFSPLRSLLACFALALMGGGDVKLLTALALVDRRR